MQPFACFGSPKQLAEKDYPFQFQLVRHITKVETSEQPAHHFANTI